MNRFGKIILGALAAAALGSAAHAQASANVSANGSVTIFRPITIAKNSDLVFGTLVRPGSGSGTVTIAQADGARTATGSIALVSIGSTPSRATFTVNGEGGQTFSIAAPATFDMTRTGGSEILTVTLNPTATTGAISGTLGNAGSAAYGVGGVITVASSTASGAYTGAFTTTVAYN